MSELKIRFSKKNLEKEAKVIVEMASDEVYPFIRLRSNSEIVQIGLKHLARSGELLKQIAIHFPRRADVLKRYLDK